MAESARAQRRAMMEEQIGLMQEQNALNAAQFQESMRLADAERQLTQQIAEQKYQWDLQDLELSRERAKEDEIILGWQRQTTEAQYSRREQQRRRDDRAQVNPNAGHRTGRRD